MPHLIPSTYRPPLGFGSGHVQSIFPALFRKVPVVTKCRERIPTPDGDFLDLDWTPSPGARLAVVSHGLEGDSYQPYIQGMARALEARGWGVLAWNFRGCSGEPNRLPRSYHSGATDDLQTVLDHVFEVGEYQRVALVGFSLGGNITLKYAGDQGADIDPRIAAAVAFSVPCDLAGSAQQMAGFGQRTYMRRFMKCLRRKIRQKIAAHPGVVRDHGLDAMRTFREFDEHYTAPLHGFAGAEDYWSRCSSLAVLEKIRIPSLLVSARDDPFLSAGCYPVELAAASEHFFFETPSGGGHVGFVPRGLGGEYWAETRAVEFLAEVV